MSEQKEPTFEQKKNFLYIGLPMKYDGDSTDVDYFLQEGGYTEITVNNIDEAVRHCIKMFERDLWQDNTSKLMLMQAEDDDELEPVRQAVKRYINQTGMARLVKVEAGASGGTVEAVEFLDDGEVIPLSDLGLNNTFGFYRLSLFPVMRDELRPPKSEM